MVNVAGRSKGCLTCRARKIKCDLSLPQCSNCTRNGHVCRGYDRPRVFVNYAVAAAANPTPTQETLVRIPTRTRVKKWRVYVGANANETIQPTETDARIVASPDSRPSERSQFLSQFLDSFCPDGYEALAPSERSAHFWVHELFLLHGRSALLDTAFSTLATTYIGESNRDCQLQRHATVLYDQSLCALTELMGQAGGVADNNVLAAIMCMGFTEVFSPLRNREHGWIAHNKGACELVESRGTALLHTELGRNLFLRLRITGLYSAIGRQETFPLADRKFHHLSKLANANYFDYLIEEMMLIPQLLKDMTDLTTETEQAVVHTRAMELFARGKATIRSLLSWLADLRLKYPNPCVWLNESADSISGSNTMGNDITGGTSGQPLYLQRLGFPNLLVAQAMMHYWAAMIILLRCVLSSIRIVGSHVPASLLLQFQSGNYLGLLFPVAHGNVMGAEQETTCDPSHILSQLADAIACSVPYCLSAKKGAVGPLVVLWPLWVIKDLHENADCKDELSQRKHEYCLRMFQGLVDRGVKFSQPLRQYTPPK
ncbi:hypothetical protein BJX96DRAFT_178783 [Aspergillus floccosus]